MFLSAAFCNLLTPIIVMIFFWIAILFVKLFLKDFKMLFCGGPPPPLLSLMPETFGGGS
jgi:hypothetical protein